MKRNEKLITTKYLEFSKDDYMGTGQVCTTGDTSQGENLKANTTWERRKTGYKNDKLQLICSADLRDRH